MIASYKLFVILCTVCPVHSYSIRGTILHDNGAESEVKTLNLIYGENWANTRELTLNRLVDTETLPSLTLVNFKSIQKLFLRNIALEHVPVFVNTSCEHIHISGNKIKSVPANAFSGPRPSRLYLNNNEIQSMADRSINIGASRLYVQCNIYNKIYTINIYNIYTINIYNKLSHFSESWFEDPGSIDHLNLRGNQIKCLQNQAFNQMTKLFWLELSYNQIASIGTECFSSAITHLYLQFNQLTQLALNMFADRDKPMEFLFLHYNQLSYVPQALLLLVKPQSISLVGNPWQCQCLRDIEGWLRELNTSRYYIPARRGEPVCVVPVNFQNVCVPAEDTELQQTYAKGLSPVQGCWASGCQCRVEDTYLKKRNF